MHKEKMEQLLILVPKETMELKETREILALRVI